MANDSGSKLAERIRSRRAQKSARGQAIAATSTKAASSAAPAPSPAPQAAAPQPAAQAVQPRGKVAPLDWSPVDEDINPPPALPKTDEPGQPELPLEEEDDPLYDAEGDFDITQTQEGRN